MEHQIRSRKKIGSFSIQQVMRWFTQAALGIKYIHEKQIIHRGIVYCKKNRFEASEYVFRSKGSNINR